MSSSSGAARRGRERFDAGLPRRSVVPAISLALGGVLFVAGGIFSGWLFLVTTVSLLLGEPAPPPVLSPVFRPAPSKPVAAPPIVARPTVAAVPVPIPTVARPAPRPTETPAADPLPTWEGSERVTILLLGIDQREDERDRNDPTRSDTLILATFDPSSNTAGLLSIPRDLWVPVPGHGSNKINTAHFFGELDKAGSGPELARRTVQYNIGVHVNYYARVDFAGFERLINAVGGITVDAERPIKDDQYPTEDYGIARILVPIGLQRMDGRTALRYARSRHADSDFGRNRRQQQVILAARDEALRLNMLPRLPAMMNILLSSVVTDMSPTTILGLASAARNVRSDDIVVRSIDSSMIIDSNGDGSVLIPDRAKIRASVLDVFTDPRIRREGARVEVLNGTTQAGLALKTADVLRTVGFTVVNVDTAPRTDYPQTVLIQRGDKRATLDRLLRELQLKPTSIQRESGAASEADFTIILGRDARSTS